MHQKVEVRINLPGGEPQKRSDRVLIDLPFHILCSLHHGTTFRPLTNYQLNDLDLAVYVHSNPYKSMRVYREWNNFVQELHSLQ